MKDLIAIGSVRTSFGVSGWAKLSSHSGEWGHFAALERVTLRKDGKERDVVVEGFRMQNGSGLAKFAGIDTPETAKALAGWELCVPPAAGAPLGDGEWYLRDLVGLSLVAADGTAYGRIAAVVQGADDLLEVQRPDGRTFLVPFRKEFTGEPDLKKGSLELTAPWLAETP